MSMLLAEIVGFCRFFAVLTVKRWRTFYEFSQLKISLSSARSTGILITVVSVECY